MSGNKVEPVWDLVVAENENRRIGRGGAYSSPSPTISMRVVNANFVANAASGLRVVRQK
jgi:hypothetical protein